MRLASRVMPCAFLPLVALLALPALASARPYAVATAGQLVTALSQASGSAEADTIQLAASTYVGNFTYSGSSDLTIAGVGATRTTLGNGVGNRAALTVSSAGSVTVQDLGVALTGGMTTSGFELSGSRVVAQDVQIVDQPAATNATGIELSGGAALRRATFSGGFSRALWVLSGISAVDALTISGASTALEAEAVGTSLIATHVLATDVNSAAIASFSGTVTLTDSLVQLRVGSGPAARATDNGNSAANSSHVILARDTVVGDTGETAVSVTADRDDAMAATVTDTILSGFTTLLDCAAVNGGTASIVTTNLAAPSGTNSVGGCPAGSVRQTGTIVANPQFVAPVSGDYRLRVTSPLIDVSDVVPAGATDLDGHPRPSAGGAACVHRGDVGAYELLLAPVASASASPLSAEAGAPVSFTAAPACDSGSAAPDAIHYHWAFDDGASADGRVVAHRFASAGAHDATLTVTDSQGQTATAHVPVTISPAVPPTIVRFTAPRGGFVSGRGAPRLGGRAGRSLTIQLSETATVTLRAVRLMPGRLRNGRCGLARRAPHGRRCTRRLPVRAIARLALPAGTSFVAFAGRLTARTALQPGRYELTLTAVDLANLSSRPRRLVVAIRRAARPHRGHR